MCRASPPRPRLYLRLAGVSLLELSGNPGGPAPGHGRCCGCCRLACCAVVAAGAAARSRCMGTGLTGVLYHALVPAGRGGQVRGRRATWSPAPCTGEGWHGHLAPVHGCGPARPAQALAGAGGVPRRSCDAGWATELACPVEAPAGWRLSTPGCPGWPPGKAAPAAFKPPWGPSLWLAMMLVGHPEKGGHRVGVAPALASRGSRAVISA